MNPGERPDNWPQPGDTVVTLLGNWRGIYTTSTVERLTKTQIVLTNGDRYRLDDLRRVGDRYADSGLMHPDSQRAVEARAEHDLQRGINLVRNHLDTANRHTTSRRFVDAYEAVDKARAILTTLAKLEP